MDAVVLDEIIQQVVGIHGVADDGAEHFVQRRTDVLRDVRGVDGRVAGLLERVIDGTGDALRGLTDRTVEVEDQIGFWRHRNRLSAHLPIGLH